MRSLASRCTAPPVIHRLPNYPGHSRPRIWWVNKIEHSWVRFRERRGQEALRARKRERNRGWMADRRREKAHRKSNRAVSVLPAGSNTKPIETFSLPHQRLYGFLDGRG